MNEPSFGKQMRFHRRNARDPLHGGPLSQDRLADLLSEDSGIIYSRAAVSDWERGKGHIHKDARHVLISLIRVLHRTGGIHTAEEADEWLVAGNYRRLNGDETTAISADWLAPPPNPSHSAMFTAPSLPSHDVVGRAELLDQLKQQLFAGRNLALSAINGLPGIGKTTLAVVLAHDHAVQELFPDGVLWTGLGRNPDVFNLLRQWARAVSISDNELDSMGAVKQYANAIHAALRDKRALLVIDDVWESEAVPLFRLGGPDCIHVLTTRQPRIAVEFAGAHALKVSELSEAYAFELLRRLAPRVVEQEPDAAWQIVRMSGGLPLALVLIGNYLRIHAATGRTRRIRAALEELRSAEKRFQLTATQSVLDQEAHPSLPNSAPLSLHAVIGISDETLSSPAQAALRALALFPPKPNSFSEEAALAVSATPDIEETEQLDALDELSDHGLLETTGQERYALHQTISDYARLGVAKAIHQVQIVNYYTHFVTENAANHAALDHDLENIEAALQAAKSLGRDELRWALLDAVFPFLEIRAHYELALDHLHELAERDLPVADQARIQRHIGRIAFKRNDSAAATTHWERGLALARSASDHDESLALLSNLSIITSQSRDYARAEYFLHEAVTEARASSNWRELCRAQANLGRLAIISDRYLEADSYLVESLAIAMKHDFPSIACAVYNMRGGTAMSLGNMEDARQYYFEGLRIARANRFDARTLELLTNLGHLLRETEQYEEAELYLDEALVLARQFEDRAKEAHILMDLGVAAAERSDLERAQEHVTAGYAVAEAIDNRWLMGLIEARWGFVEMRAGRLDTAVQRFEEAVRWAGEASNNKEIIGLAQFGLAQVAYQTGHSAQARSHLDIGLAALDGSGLKLTEELKAWRTANLT